MQEIIYNFISPDLLILIPVLFLISNWLKKSSIKSSKIPYITSSIGVTLSNIYIISNIKSFNFRELSAAIFSSFCQGILISGASIFTNQIKISTNKNSNKNEVRI